MTRCPPPVALAALSLALYLAAPAAATETGAAPDRTPEGWVTSVYPAPAARATTVRETGSTDPSVTVPHPSLNGRTHLLDGIASFYWQGQMTASGEPFDKLAMTAAHKTLPFGTRVKVTNLGNGRSTVVRINDRGPFKPGRVIDVSEAAAEILGMRGRGLAPVRLEVVGKVN